MHFLSLLTRQALPKPLLSPPGVLLARTLHPHVASCSRGLAQLLPAPAQCRRSLTTALPPCAVHHPAMLSSSPPSTSAASLCFGWSGNSTPSSRHFGLPGGFLSAMARFYSQSAPSPQNHKVFTVPNALSFFRLVSSPFLVYMFVTSQYNAGALLFLLAAISDFLDGFIARRLPSQRSVLGTALDPMADKAFMICTSSALAYIGSMPLPLAALIIARDVGLIAGASYYRWKTTEPPRTVIRLLDVTQVATEFNPTLISKINTVNQFCTTFLAVLSLTPYSLVDAATLHALWWSVGATTFLSGLSYVRNKDAVRLLKLPPK